MKLFVYNCYYMLAVLERHQWRDAVASELVPCSVFAKTRCSGTQVDMSLPFCRAGWGLNVEGPDSCILSIFMNPFYINSLTIQLFNLNPPDVDVS